MNSQQLMDEIFEKYSEWIEHDQDNAVFIQILAGLLLRERQTSENLTMKVKRLEALLHAEV